MTGHRPERWSCRVPGEIEQGLPGLTGDEDSDRAAVRPGFFSVLRSRDVLLLGLARFFSVSSNSRRSLTSSSS